MFVGGVVARERGSAAYCAQDHIVRQLAGVEDPSARFCSLVRMVRGWGGVGGPGTCSVKRQLFCMSRLTLPERVFVRVVRGTAFPDVSGYWQEYSKGPSSNWLVLFQKACLGCDLLVSWEPQAGFYRGCM